MDLLNFFYIYFKNSIKYINIVIADFEGGGVFPVVSKQKRKEKYQILYKYYGLSGLTRGFVYRLFIREIS